MTKKLRWGIMGSGRIANQMAGALALSETCELAAVGSRSSEKAKEFAAKYGIRKSYGSYEELAQDDGLDVIYIATPQPYHAENSILAMQNGKHVLCEKPFALNATQAACMIRVAEEQDVFLMEAMWTRFLPSIVRMRELIAEGAIGEVRMVHADFGIRVGWDPKSRILDANLGGGALLDLGIYPISLASFLLGNPVEITGVAHLGETGVDEQFIAAMRYEQGRLAVATGSIRTTTHKKAWIYGTEGMFVLDAGWWGGQNLTLIRNEKEERLEFKFASNNFIYQVEEVASCLREGRMESSVMPLAETLELMKTMDTLRKQWGFVYPAEKE